MSAEADLARDLEEEKRRRFLPPRLLKDLVCSIDSIGLDQLWGRHKAQSRDEEE